MGSPSDDNVDQFIAFTAADKSTATVFLQGADNDLNRAIDNYFQYDGNVSRYKQDQASRNAANTWDESAFAADRDAGNLNAGALVPYSETHGPQPAPSRPPSRSHGKTPQNASYGGWQSSSWDPGPGDDMTRAIQASLQDQTTGVTSAFEWDDDTDQTSRAVVPDAEPMHRNRQAWEPVYLKPLPNRDALPAILSVIHHIPLVRESLSFPGLCVSDYGYNPNWWKGEGITTSEVREYSFETGDDSRSSSSKEDEVKIAKELQRLLVFLQFSNRSYGSANALAEALGTPAEYFPPYSDIPPFERALQRFDSLLEQVPDSTALFTSYVSVKDEQDPTKSSPKWYFDATVQQGGITLYDALDEALWGSVEHPTRDAEKYLKQLSPIAIIRARLPDPTGAKRSISVPSTFFADRFMTENANAMQEIRARTRALLAKAQQAERKINALTKHYLNPPMVEADVSKMIEAVMNYASHAATEEQAELEPVMAQIRVLSARVEKRVQELSEGKSQAQKGIQQLAAAFTKDAQDLAHVPKAEYKLRGVISMEPRRPCTVYFAAPDKGQVSGASDGGLSDAWWKMAYDDRAHQPRPQLERVGLDEAVEFAGVCDPEKILVYASAGALEDESEDVDISALHQQLRDFVTKDNEVFEEELDGALRQTAPTSQMDAMPPESTPGLEQQLQAAEVQRQQRRGSNDSTTVLGSHSPRLSIASAEDEDGEEMMMSAEAEHRAFASSAAPAAGASPGPTEARRSQGHDVDGDVDMER